MKVSLYVASGAHQGKVIPVATQEFTIGRDRACHLRPASQAISKRHCGLVVRDGLVYLTDYGSTNGTLVNGVMVRSEEVEVPPDSTLTIGPLDFVLRVEAAAGAGTVGPAHGAGTGHHDATGADDHRGTRLERRRDPGGRRAAAGRQAGREEEGDQPRGDDHRRGRDPPEDEAAAQVGRRGRSLRCHGLLGQGDGDPVVRVGRYREPQGCLSRRELAAEQVAGHGSGPGAF